MKHDELERLLRELESDRVERTSSINDTKKFCGAICAFANDMPDNRLPGYLFVGANEDGSASGAAITDRLLLNLGALRDDGNIQPLPVMVVQKQSLGGGEMAVVEVTPSDLPPVRFKGRVWIRVGPRRAIASESDERILVERRTRHALTWDAQASGASLDDLALDLFVLSYRSYAVAPEVVADNERELDDQLAALRFFDPRAGSPTNAALLLFAKDPLFFVPGAYIQYVRYDGGSQADPVLRDRRVSGDLLTVMRDLARLAEEVAGGRPEAASGLSERFVYDYPPKAMRELLMNAVIHRNYAGTTSPVMVNHFADRIEIQNSGGLYPDLTPEVFPRGTAYRNPIVAEAAKTLGFVNRYGRGIAIANAELTRNGSQEVDFELKPNHVLATVWRRT